jgi:hypothetical protein
MRLDFIEVAGRKSQLAGVQRDVIGLGIHGETKNHQRRNKREIDIIKVENFMKTCLLLLKVVKNEEGSYIHLIVGLDMLVLARI